MHTGRLHQQPTQRTRHGQSLRRDQALLLRPQPTRYIFSSVYVCVDCVKGERVWVVTPLLNKAAARSHIPPLFRVQQSSVRQKTGPSAAVVSFTRISRRTPGTCPALSKPWWRACRDLWMVSGTHTNNNNTHTCDGIQLQAVSPPCFFPLCLHRWKEPAPPGPAQVHR